MRVCVFKYGRVASGCMRAQLFVRSSYVRNDSYVCSCKRQSVCVSIKVFKVGNQVHGHIHLCAYVYHFVHIKRKIESRLLNARSDAYGLVLVILCVSIQRFPGDY